MLDRLRAETGCIAAVMRSGMFRNINGIFLCLLLLGVGFYSRAEDVHCDLCGKVIVDTMYTVDDLVEGKEKHLCFDCHNIKERCYFCQMPVRGNFKALPDGRYICERDLRNTVQSEDDAKQIAKDAKDDIDRLFSRFISFPSSNIEISIVDRFHLENLFHAPGNAMRCVSVYGATTSNPLSNGGFLHSIDLLSYISKTRLRCVAAHEFGHTWVAENVTPERQRILDKNTHEAFCELIAWKYMESLHEEGEAQSIKSNTYTAGKIEVLLAADAKYGFNTVTDWMKDGEDSTFTLTNLDRVRFLKDSAPPRHDDSVDPLYLPSTPPSSVPNVLTLKGISSAGPHRFALINDATIEQMERARVRVGQTNVIVRCLEIRSNSVVVEIAGSKEKKELFINTK